MNNPWEILLSRFSADKLDHVILLQWNLLTILKYWSEEWFSKESVATFFRMFSLLRYLCNASGSLEYSIISKLNLNVKL